MCTRPRRSISTARPVDAPTHFSHSAPPLRGSRSVLRVAALNENIGLYGIAAATVGALGFVGWKAYLYFQLEFITAAMIGNHVQKGGARVLQIGGGTRELYYYPNGTIQVTVTQSKAMKGKGIYAISTGRWLLSGVLDNAGVAAKIPVVVRDSVDLGSAAKFNLGPSEAYNAIVLLDRFSGIANQDAFLQDLFAVLKPNGTLIFIEKSVSLVNCLKERDLFDDVQCDVALEGQDDRFVGIATKAAGSSKNRKETKTGFASP